MSGMVNVVTERDGAWRRVVLDAPPGNLLSLEMVRAIDAALDTMARPDGVQWVTFEGGGGEFSFGARIQEHAPDECVRVLPETHALFKRLLAFPAPTAALVEGRCLGGGFELALACDDILATRSAEFGLPEIRLGAFPPAAAALLPLRVGAARATRAIVTGQTQDAGYWNDAGLVSMVAPQSSLLDAAGSWFDANLRPHSAAALSHAALAARITVRAQAEPALEAAERQYLSSLLKTADATEGVEAWIEKRAPRWKNN